MILELGGGETPNYCKQFGNGINIDALDSPFVDIKHDLNNLPLPVKDGEYEEVYLRFLIEHISWRLLPSFIAELYRITKPGGKVRIIAPNFKAQCEILSRTKDWNLEQWICMAFGDQNYKGKNWIFNAHASSCSPELYEALLRKAGFRYISIAPLPEWIGDQEIIVIK